METAHVFIPLFRDGDHVIAEQPKKTTVLPDYGTAVAWARYLRTPYIAECNVPVDIIREHGISFPQLNESYRIERSDRIWDLDGYQQHAIYFVMHQDKIRDPNLVLKKGYRFGGGNEGFRVLRNAILDATSYATHGSLDNVIISFIPDYIDYDVSGLTIVLNEDVPLKTIEYAVMDNYGRML